MGLGILVQPLEPLGHPTGNRSAAPRRKPRDLLERMDRLDARHDRRGDPRRPRPFDETEVIVVVEEHLGDGARRAGIELALQVVDIGFPVRALRVFFRIGRHRDVERADAANPRDEVRSIPVALWMRRERLADALCRVTAQRHDATDPCFLIAPHHRIDLVPRRADAGEMRGRVDPGLGLHPADHPERALARRAAGAVGHRDEARMQWRQLVDRLPEPLLHDVSLGRKELERDLEFRPLVRAHAARAVGVVSTHVALSVSSVSRQRHTVSPSVGLLGGKDLSSVTLRSAARAQPAICASLRPRRRCA